MNLLKTIRHDLLLILALLVVAGIVYAVGYGCFLGPAYCAVQKGGTTQRLTVVPGAPGTCIDINNYDPSKDVFVPANSLAEWNAFTGHLPPNVTLSSPAGQACTSSPNACGMTNSGTRNSCGVCSVSTPPDSLCGSTCGWQSGGGVCNREIDGLAICSASPPEYSTGGCFADPSACSTSADAGRTVTTSYAPGNMSGDNFRCDETLTCVCSAGTACTISLQAAITGGGGAPGGPVSVNLGWGISINNAGGASSCGVTVVPSEAPKGAYTGPSYSAPAGGSFGEGPFGGTPAYYGNTYTVGISASSVVCPTGTHPVPATGWNTSCFNDVNQTLGTETSCTASPLTIQCKY